MRKFTVFLLLIGAALAICACGGTTVKVKQSSDGVNATVSVQTNNPTNVDVTPSVSVKLDDLAPFLDAVQDSLQFDEHGEMTLSSSQVREIIKNYR